jgi:hypothetical protein
MASDSTQTNSFTPFPDVNAILGKLLENVQPILGNHLIGLYLEGSLANGDFDPDSDIDFVVVTDEEVRGELFSELQRMHDHIATLDSPWAVELEGSYVSRAALRRYDPANNLHPNLERGRGERLKMVNHDEVWNIHRHILRERGITIMGPDPKDLIDPISSSDLKRAMAPALNSWATYILEHPEIMEQRGYQSYVVLSLCRIIYTLQVGEVVSKRRAADWAKTAIDPRWTALIEDAREGRHLSNTRADPQNIHLTMEFIREVLKQGRQAG